MFRNIAKRRMSGMLLIAACAWACAPSQDEKAAPAPAPAAAAASPESIGARPSPDKPRYKPIELTPIQVQERRAKGETIVLVDVRSKAAFDTAHIDGALSMPWSKLPEGHKQLPKDVLMALYCT